MAEFGAREMELLNTVAGTGRNPASPSRAPTMNELIQIFRGILGQTFDYDNRTTGRVLRIKLSDGNYLQVCWATVQLPNGTDEDYHWTFPAPFRDNRNAIIINPITPNGNGIQPRIVTQRPGAAKYVEFSVTNTAGTRFYPECECIALGMTSEPLG